MQLSSVSKPKVLDPTYCGPEFPTKRDIYIRKPLASVSAVSDL
jgi:hypothetical protein